MPSFVFSARPIVSLLLIRSPAGSALTIALDYSPDNNGFFGDAMSNAVVDQATDDINSAITSSLSAVDKLSFTSSKNPDITTYSAAVFFSHREQGPSPSRKVTSNPVAADTVVVYAGSRMLGGATLGTADFSTVTPGTSRNSLSTVPTMEAVDDSHNTHVERGGGAVLSQVRQDISAALRAGATVGNLWFDHDADNKSSMDTGGWYLDHTTAAAFGMDGLYSVAWHEILHAVGIGGALSWDENVSGTTWTGSAAQDAAGVKSGIMADSLADGGSHEEGMSPSIVTGTRKTLTDVDLAFFRDAGDTTIPQPGTSKVLVLGASLLIGYRGRRSLLP